MKNGEDADSEDWTLVLGLPASACEIFFLVSLIICGSSPLNSAVRDHKWVALGNSIKHMLECSSAEALTTGHHGTPGKDHMRTGAQQQHGAASEVRRSIMEGFPGGT